MCISLCRYPFLAVADWWDSDLSSLDDWNFPTQSAGGGIQSSSSNAKAASSGTRSKASSLSVSKGGGSALSSSSALSDGQADAEAESAAISEKGIDATAIADVEAKARKGDRNRARAAVNVLSTGGFSRGRAKAFSEVIPQKNQSHNK